VESLLDADAEREFADFYRRTYPDAKRLAHLLLSGSPDADDVVQDAYSGLHRRYRAIANPAAYLRVSVVNGAKQHRRRRSRERDRLRLVAGGATDVETPPDPLLDAVATLDYRQRAAIVLRYWAGLGDDEIAELLGVRQTSVRTLVHRALQRLRKELPR